jgi:sialidase-1
VELDNGDWLLASQWRSKETGYPTVWATRSRDKGKTWDKPVAIVGSKIYKFCEASILKLPGGKLVCYVRENSSKGLPIYKCISYDNGHTWQGPFETPMNAGHRPVAHLTRSGKVLITYRFQPAGTRPWAKNTFAYLESPESALELNLTKQHGTVLPIDHDRNSHSDSGYTGWVETEPGRFLVVNYIKDDAPLAQIRGYRFAEKDF